MTQQKTKSLTLSTNPVARLRELADLDAPNPVVVRRTESSNTAALQRENSRSPEPISAEALKHSNTQADEHSNDAAQQRHSAATPPPANAETRSGSGDAGKKQSSAKPRMEVSDDNPVRQAMRQALVQPYSADLSKGPTTASTIRIPTEIWERLDMASTLQGQTKQDIIAESLKRYLGKIGRGEA